MGKQTPNMLVYRQHALSLRLVLRICWKPCSPMGMLKKAEPKQTEPAHSEGLIGPSDQVKEKQGCSGEAYER